MIHNITQRPFSSVYVMMGLPAHQFSLDKLISDACIALSTTIEEMHSKTRKTHVKTARWLVWYCMRSQGKTLTQCGAVFGHDHSTVISCLQHIEWDIEQDEMTGKAFRRLEAHYKPKRDNF